VSFWRSFLDGMASLASPFSPPRRRYDFLAIHSFNWEIEIGRIAFFWRPKKFDHNLMWLGLDILWYKDSEFWSYHGDMSRGNFKDIKRRAKI